MKKIIFIVSFLSSAGVLFATTNVISNANTNENKASVSIQILKLLNSRASGSLHEFSEAAKAVAREAKEGGVLQQYLIAVLSGPSASCEALRISEKERDEYLKASRPKIEALANKTSNPLTLYLMSLEKNDEKLLKRAADGNNPQALNAWGTLTLMRALSDFSLEVDDRDAIIKNSVECFRRAAAQKDSNGLYNLGMCAMNGYGDDEDPQLAFNYFRSAAEAGHPDAINNLGGFCRDGIVVEKDLVLATKWFAKSAKLGNLYGQFNYALALQRGEGTTRDIKRALELFIDAAGKGSCEAMNAYAMCLLTGDGCEKNETEAIRWFRRSAQRGFAPAMENLAECHAAGKGGLKKDAKKSVLWKVRARAIRGDRNAAAWLTQNGHTICE